MKKLFIEIYFSIGGFTFWICENIIQQSASIPLWLDFFWHENLCEPIYLRHRKVKRNGKVNNRRRNYKMAWL